MKKIELVEGIYSSALGFGCAPILGSIDAKQAKRALEVAFELGVNHIDLARSYGYGEAERFVGKLIGSRRNDMILSSKFGIKANWKAKIMRPLKPIIRQVKNNSKAKEVELFKQKSSFRDLSDFFHDRIDLNPKNMKLSLERSLKELGTDYLDYFFIHEPQSCIHNIDELLNMAEILKKHGKIRAFGLAFMRDQEHLHKNYINKFDILQFDSMPEAPNYDENRIERRNVPNILFSPIKESANLKPEEKLIQLIKDYPKSVILSSMVNEAQIKRNAKLFD